MTKLKKFSITSKVKELDKLVNYFEQENKELDIDRDIFKYEQAMKIVDEVKKELETIELKINEIKQKYQN